VERPHRTDRGDRTKYLLAADGHVRRDVVEDGRTNKIAVRTIFNARLPAINEELRPFRHPLVDVGSNAVPVLRADHRPHRDVWIEPIANLERPRGLDHPIARLVV